MTAALFNKTRGAHWCDRIPLDEWPWFVGAAA